MTCPRASFGRPAARRPPARGARPCRRVASATFLSALPSRDPVDRGADAHVALADPRAVGAAAEVHARRRRPRTATGAAGRLQPVAETDLDAHDRAAVRLVLDVDGARAPDRAIDLGGRQLAARAERQRSPARRAAWRPRAAWARRWRPGATGRRWACADRRPRPPVAEIVPASQSIVRARQRLLQRVAAAVARAPRRRCSSAATAASSATARARYSHSIVAGGFDEMS